MKVVIDALSARIGGGQTYLLNLLGNPEGAAGMEIHVAAPGSLRLPEHPAIHRLEPEWPTENVLARSVWQRRRLPRLLRELGADVLFCPGGLVNTTPPPGCRTVTMFRNMLPFDAVQLRKYGYGYIRLRNWIQARAMLRSMLAADLVIFVSEFARRRIEERAGRPLRHGITIPHGLDDHFRARPEARPPRPAWLPQGEYLLYVSIFHVYKNQLEVVRGFRELRTRRGGKEKLLLVGPDDLPYAAVVREEIRRLGLDGEVILAGKVPYEELPWVYQHAKVNLFASECENCPNIVLEALGAGRPLVVSDRPPMPEFAGEAAVYFDPSSPADLAAKLVALLEDPARMERLGRLARQRSLGYSWKSTAERTWRAIRALAAGESPQEAVGAGAAAGE